MTHEDYMISYVEARRSRIAREAQGPVERAGYHLLMSARGTDDGQPDVEEALVSALKSGDVGAALEIGSSLVELPEIESDPRRRSRCNGNFAVSGEIRRAR